MRFWPARLPWLLPTAAFAPSAYDPEQIVRIVGKSGIQSTIEFAADEQIENVAVGDSSAWQITPNRRASLLFVKPLAAHSRTNMTVVTDKRTYMFDLVAGEESAAPVYALKFSYPEREEGRRRRSLSSRSASRLAAGAPATMTADKLHFDWNSKGNGKLLPARVFDDGSSLYLAWNKETPLPAILTQSEDRKEGPVNYRLSGEYIVISPVPAEYRAPLRQASRRAVADRAGSFRLSRASAEPPAGAIARPRRRRSTAAGAQLAARQAPAPAPPTHARPQLGEARQHDLALQRQADGCRQ